MLVSASARGDDLGAATESPTRGEEPNVVEARREFVRGAALVKDAQWAEALAAFERSRALRPHPATTYNIGSCERALGHYTKARLTLRRALEEAAASPGALSEGVTKEITELVSEVDAMIARLEVTIEPAGAAIAVDGRPLAPLPGAPNARPQLVAGVRSVGAAERAPKGSFEVLVDPGAHVLTLSRRGFADATVNRAFEPGSTTALPLVLNLLPATLHIAADRPGAVVTVEGLDVGVAPVDVTRPGGSYRVSVRKKGFTSYDTRVVVQPGETANLRATLPEHKPALTERWWFWSAAGVVVVGAALTTYFATRPAPERPAVDGGGLGWARKLQ